MKRIRVGLAAAVVLAVSACGSIHPGAAVVVGDESVSTDKVDDLAGNLCGALEATGQSGVAGSDARQQAVTMMLTLTAARQAADDLGVELAASDYAVTADEEASLKKRFPDAEYSEIEQLIQISKETSALLTAIGEEQGSSGQKAQQAGQKYLQDYIADADVDIAPRYGLDDTGQPVKGDALSVLVSSDPDSQQKPSVPALQC